MDNSLDNSLNQSASAPPILQEVLPKAGLVYSEKGNLSEARAARPPGPPRPVEPCRLTHARGPRPCAAAPAQPPR